MVTGPAKNGHSCNQAWGGRGLRHPSSSQAAGLAPPPQLPGCHRHQLWLRDEAQKRPPGRCPGTHLRSPRQTCSGRGMW